MSGSAETLVSKSTQLVHSARGTLEKLSPQAELFIFFAGILQRYRVVPHPAHALPAENEFVFHELGRNSKPFHVLFVKEALE